MKNRIKILGEEQREYKSREVDRIRRIGTRDGRR